MVVVTGVVMMVVVLNAIIATVAVTVLMVAVEGYQGGSCWHIEISLFSLLFRVIHLYSIRLIYTCPGNVIKGLDGVFVR